MEHVILVDAKDREIGTEEKLVAHRRGLLHRAFSIFIFNSSGKLLLQRRNPAKYHSGGLYSNACCSHPRPGEDIEAAAHRRLREEMGFECELTWAFPLVYRSEFEDGLVENEYDHVFVGRYDGLVKPDPLEVEDIMWISPGELRAWLMREPGDFTVWFRLCVEAAIEFHESIGVADRAAGSGA